MFTLNCKGRLLTFDQPLVMGIINLTPDSFYAGSRATADAVLRQAEAMLVHGADWLDLGGQSTRPGSGRLSAAEELQRIIDPIQTLQEHFPELIISVDTYHARVAKEAVMAGASIVNDISGGQLDPAMLSTVASLHVPYIFMHMKGTPETMQQLAVYDNVVQEVLDYFISAIHRCREAGIHDVILDPGFGFAKNTRQNFELLKNLSVLRIPGKPVLAGLSRKSSIYRTLGITADEALNGTTVLNTVALMNGANILRVHDVKEAKEVVRLIKEIGYPA